jgi:hypothetical protein
VSTTPATDTHKLLVIAAEAVDGDAVRDAVLEHAQARDVQVRLVAPAIDQSKLEHVMGDVDEATARARERLERSAHALERAGLQPVEARVGDADLKQAISDALGDFAADEILIVAHSGDAPSFERDWIDQAEREFPQPITEVFVERLDGEAQVADVEHKPAGQTDRAPGEVEGQSPNMPPFAPRDVLGIVVAIVGTIVLVVLAAIGGGDDLNSTGGFGSETGGGLTNQTVRVIIAGAMALINLAHVVALTLFQAGAYRGGFRSLFANLSLYGTPAAIAASLILLLAD